MSRECTRSMHASASPVANYLRQELMQMRLEKGSATVKNIGSDENGARRGALERCVRKRL